MAFNNAVNANQQGTQYLSTGGAWSGVDGSTAGFVLTSNGTGVAPSFQVPGFVGTTAWTPTVTGGTIAGVTTYTTQTGSYSVNGDYVYINIDVRYTAATGTGDLLVGNLPFASVGEQYIGASLLSGVTWPAARTNICFANVVGGTTAVIISSGSALITLRVQIANVVTIVQGSLIYRMI